MRNHLRRHPNAGVGDAEGHVWTGGQVEPAGRMFVKLLVPGFDRQPAAADHRVARVEAQVEKPVLELAGVDQNVPEIRAGDRFHRDFRPDRAPDKLFHAEDELIDVCGLRIERLAPRKGQQTMGQGRGAPDGALRRLHITVDFARTPLGDAGLHEIEAALDAGQNIVEVVREAAGELADGLHLLRLPQRCLGGGQASPASFSTVISRPLA